jgi:hypothetical protein
MINSVRNTVLSVLNKNNYGYISPSDFNLYAKQAQMEIFEEYFANYNKLVNGQNSRVVGSDYADLLKANEEVIEFFLVSRYLFPKTIFNPALLIQDPYNAYFPPSLTTTGDEAFMINSIVTIKKIIQGVNDILVPFMMRDSTTVFPILVFPGYVIFNLTTMQTAIITGVVSNGVYIDKDIFLNTGEGYAIYNPDDYAILEKVSEGKIASLNSSNLTKPNLIYPAYTMTELSVNIYPDTIKGYGAINATYFRYPKEPKWTYVSLLGGEPSFDQSQPDYQDFELPAEDEYKLAMKILQYCGISIREVQVAQFAIAQEQQPQQQ